MIYDAGTKVYHKEFLWTGRIDLVFKDLRASGDTHYQVFWDDAINNYIADKSLIVHDALALIDFKYYIKKANRT